MTDSVHTIKWTETALKRGSAAFAPVGQRYLYRVERREVVVVIVAVGRRKAKAITATSPAGR